jgi:hypothetical protein
MWISVAVVFIIWSRWDTGKEIKRRQAYWDTQELIAAAAVARNSRAL